MQTYFIICAIVAAVGLLGAFVNMGVAATQGLGKWSVIAHLVCEACWAIGGLGAVVFGILWAVQHFSA